MKSTVSKALRNIVAERDSYTCVLCENGYTDMHHVTPRSQGGRNNPQNLVSLCRKCHMAVHREIPATDEWLEDADQRMVEYVSDFYAFDGLDVPGPIDHDSFTIYKQNHHPFDNTPKITWDDLNAAQKRLIGQYWDKDKGKWVTIFTKD